MGFCSENNPCSCISTVTTKVTTPCPDPQCCIKACDAVIRCENAVGPCGQVGTTNLSDIEHDLSGCGDNAVIYRLTEYDKDIFTSVYITTAGVLTWVTAGPDTVGKYGQICYKAVCKASDECDADCQELASNAKITIGVRDLCIANACEACETCDPCTAECVKDDTNIVAGAQVNRSNISTQ